MISRVTNYGLDFTAHNEIDGNEFLEGGNEFLEGGREGGKEEVHYKFATYFFGKNMYFMNVSTMTD